MAEPDELMNRIGGQWAGEELQETFQKEVAHLLGRNNHNFPGAQPVSFAARHISELKARDYYVCEKTDGLRYLLYCSNEGPQDIHYLVDRKNNYYYVRNLHFPHQSDETFNKFHSETIFDGELVEDKYTDGRPSVIKYLVFDCLVLDNQNLMQKTLDKRLGYFKQFVLTPYKKMFEKTPDLPRPFILEDKATEFSYGMEKMFKEIIPRVKQLHGNDGLIFTCRTSDYKFGTDEHILKWKPPHDNTVDFLLHLAWPTMEPDSRDPDQTSQLDYLAMPEKFELFQYHGGTDYRLFDEMYVTAEEWERMKALGKPLNDIVVECYLEIPPSTNGHAANGNGKSSKRWRFYRFRDDKENGNFHTIVQNVMESIKDHVTEEDLLDAAPDIRTAWKNRASQEAQMKK